MKRKLSPRALYGVAVGGLLVYALFGWFVFVGPKRAEAVRLKEEVAAAQLAVTTARAAAEVKSDVQPIAVADIFRLAKAMPAVPDMPGILLELSRIAGETGIEFRSISPQASGAAGDYQSMPITLVFDGNFYELSDFLFRLRTLVGVRRGELHARGRLFAVNTIGFAESAQGFPEITATLTVNAFVYGTAVPAGDVPPVVAGSEGTTTTTGEAPVPAAGEPTSEAAAAEATP